MIPWIISDLDGTLANIDHRLHHIQKENPDYEAFYNEVYKDEPIQPLINLLQALNERYVIAIVTGRSEVCRSATALWLDKHRVPYQNLIMRPKGNHAQDHILKKRMVCDHEGKLLFPAQLVIEDRARVVEMWRDMGLTCLQVAKGDY